MRIERKWTKDQRRPYILITDDGERIDLRKVGKERGGSLSARRASSSKYRNVLTEYNGKWYHSQAEAEYAARLDQLIRAGEVKEWGRQAPFDLVVNGIKIGRYWADFLVRLSDGSTEVHEVKGVMTEVARMKLALFEALYPEIKLVVVRV